MVGLARLASSSNPNPDQDPPPFTALADPFAVVLPPDFPDPPDSFSLLRRTSSPVTTIPLPRLVFAAADSVIGVLCCRFVNEFLVLLGFSSSYAVASCERWYQCNILILWLLCSPCPSLVTSLVPDLTSMTCASSPIDDSCQRSDWKTLRSRLHFSSLGTMTVLPSGKIDYVLFWCEYGSCTSPLWLLFDGSMCFKDSEHYYRTIPPMNLTFDDQLTHRCSPQTPLISIYSDHNDQRFNFDSGKSLWFHHGNAGIDKFCWELEFVPLEIGVKLILLSTGVEESSSLMFVSFQGVTLLSPLATTIQAQQMEFPSSEAYVLGIAGLSHIVTVVNGACSLMSSKICHQPVSPTSTNVYARLIQSSARSHSLLEDSSPVALIKMLLKPPHVGAMRDHYPSSFSLQE